MPSIRPFTDDDSKTNEVASLITSHFADGWSYDVPVNNESAGTYVRVAEQNDTPVGVMALTIYESRKQLQDAMHLIDTVEQIPPESRYGFIHAGYVDPDRTGEGIGSSLIERLHDIGESRDVDHFIADAWFHGGPDSPAQLLTTHEYDIVHTHSIAGHTDGPCPKCGTSCVCEAALAVRPVPMS
ncbi:GNAT family N-acetyltransferase [Haloquadratum walsbyi]|jgi:Acetyltransferase (GNAT) family.|uniref:Acetyltransferase (GNAT) family n=1 Tax=Haloquadratum walsbyi J07HQW2 TaxID=1238425 RepID=U1N2L6_9EURY|nr:GNAT family N-acetyltransferase [Haloquadratum walsbyi]ERG97124.1 MAG: acetyltransferase (GNAT) family [Haloquadratum walsbyi J07HQW2]